MEIILGIILFFTCIYTRVWVRFLKRDFGVDTWYFLNYAEGFRKQKSFPVKLNNYLLDIEEQWYPPFLAVLLSFFSKKITDKYHWLFSGVIDSLHGLVLYIFSIVVCGRIDVALFAYLLFISSTINASMATNLNARPLASIILTFVMLLLYQFSITPSALTFILIVLTGVTLLHSHKMGTQQLIFFCAGLFLLFHKFLYIGLLLLIFVSAIVLSRGFYLKILRNNIEIILFWAKNLHFLLKHQVYASSLYKNEEKARQRIGISGLKMNKFMFMFARAQLVIFLVIIAVFYIIHKTSPDFNKTKFLFFWVFTNYFTVLSTTYLPIFKFIGEGFKYLIYGTFPLSFLIAYAFIIVVKPAFAAYLILMFMVFLSVYVQYFTLSRQLLNVNSYVDDELKQVISILKTSNKDNIMCIPVFKAEPIAYLAGKKVLWGAHGSGWNKLDEFWPVIKVPIDNIIQKYAINRILIDKRFVDIGDLKINNHLEKIFDGQFYLLVDVMQ